MKTIEELWFTCPNCGTLTVDGSLLEDYNGKRMRMGMCTNCDEWVEEYLDNKDDNWTVK